MQLPYLPTYLPVCYCSHRGHLGGWYRDCVSSTTQTRPGRRHRRTGGCWAEKGPVLAGIKHWELGGFWGAFYRHVVHRGDATGSIRGARG